LIFALQDKSLVRKGRDVMHCVAISNPTAHTDQRIVDLSFRARRKVAVQQIFAKLLLLALVALPFSADAKIRRPDPGIDLGANRFAVTQRNGMSLNEAVESVRRRGDVERILDARTRNEGGREVHYIKYMTKDGTVRTQRINGRRN
jgi:hypothetical protein